MDYKSVYNKLTSQCSPAKVMAVSKTRSLDEIKAAYSAGFKLFGENHVQEIVEKFASWHPDDVSIHMIGHLQSNKVNKVVPLVDMIESVDSCDLLVRINNCAERTGKVMPVLLEVNTSEEEAKSGFDSENELFDCLEKAETLGNVKIEGFMTVGPLDHSKAGESFAKLRNLSKLCKEKYPDIGCVLSMGMSQDYEIALKEGSNLVRIGTLIFGERDYTK